MFPGAFFLEDGVVFRAETDWNEQRDPRDIQDAARLARNVRDDMRRCVNAHNAALLNDTREALGLADDAPLPQDVTVLEDVMPVPASGRLEFVIYRYARAVPGCNYFVCQDSRCERLYHLRDVGPEYRCPIHNRPLAQLAHLFVHGRCGSWSEIEPQTCRSCNEQLRLHLEARNLRRSYWWCPNCRTRSGVPEYSIRREDGTWINGWKQRVYRWCANCRAQIRAEARSRALLEADQSAYDPSSTAQDTGGFLRMGLVPARTALKPRTMTAVDMPAEDERIYLDRWFGGGVDEEAVRAGLEDPTLQALFDTNAAWKSHLLAAKRNEQQMASESEDPIPSIREEIRDYAGAVSATHMRLADEDAGTAEYLEHNYGLRVTLLDRLAVVNATIGYLVGSSDPSQAQLQAFWMGRDRYAVLTERSETEAMLFELIPERVGSWLGARGHTGINDEESLRRHLVFPTLEENGRLSPDPIWDDILVLLHTVSHLLIRGSERYTGVSRDTLLEIIFPRALAFVLYDSNGSDLGMLQTTFEGNLQDWIMGAKYDVANCPHDPICRNDQVSACHACLYIAERCCNTYWNRCLDRRHVVRFGQSGAPGYWGDVL